MHYCVVRRRYLLLCSGLWLAETFPTYTLKPLSGIQRNLTGSIISTSSTKFVFFGLIRKQDGRPGLWLRHFRLLLRNRWTEFNETGQEARFSRLLPSLFFFWPIKKQDGRSGPWLVETFSNSLKPLNGIQRNLMKLKCLEKQDGRPGLWLAKTFLLLWNC